MKISGALLQEVVGHAREDPGNEVCGLVAVTSDGERAATRVYRARNVHESPMKFEIDPKERERGAPHVEAVATFRR